MKRLFTSLVLIAAGAAAWWFFVKSDSQMPKPTTTPAQATPLADNQMVVDYPLPGSYISSPLVVKGKARGTWFFEASFPIVLADWDGKIIAEGHVNALSDWMTTDFVPFEGTLTFTKSAGNNNRGFLILRKDNPSGLSQYDDAREITVFFR
jgi:immunoglobulin-like protein involved in spore germination